MNMTRASRSLPFATSVLVLLVGTALSACARDDTASGVAAEPATTAETKSRAVLGAPELWEPAPEDGVELGFGWDSRKGRIVPNRCVSLTPIRATGQIARVSLSEVSDTSEVMKSLSVSASVAVKTMFASGSAAASFAKSSKVSAQSTTFLLDATVENGVLFAGPRGDSDEARLAYPSVETHTTGAGTEPSRLTFQPWAQQLLRSSGEFRGHCGDAYVSAVSSGARLFATISFSSNNSKTSESISTAIKGTYGPVKAEANAAAAHAATLANTSLEVHYLQVGGAGGEIAMTKDDLLLKLKELAGEADESPRFQFIRLTPYSQMPEWRGTDTWQQAEDEFEIIADYYWQLTNLDDEIDTILGNYAAYNTRTGKSKDDLKLFQDDILQLRKLIYSAMQPDMDDETPAAARDSDNGTVPLSLFAAPATGTFRAPTAVDFAVLSGNPTLDDVADELAAASPFENPSLLRIHLPIPSHVTTATDAASLRQSVVDWYVRPRARRACDRDPTSNDCLTNAEIDEVVEMVQVR